MPEIQGLGRDALDRARLSRDPRFDGRFYIAVMTTGVYCRPICPSPTCRSTNVIYFPTAAAAAEAGFRPCLRCRPEAAPGTPAWFGTSAVVRRALRLIHEGVLDEQSVEDLAARVGVGTRHLHRLFVRHVGASPIAVAQTRRLHFAKRLLDETSLSITDTALASGFSSIRRFNEAFRTTYGRSPREIRSLRRGGGECAAGNEVVLRLAYRPPYDWEQVCRYLAGRAVAGVERIDYRGYARTILSHEGPAIIRVRPLKGEHSLALRVSGAGPASLLQISSIARRVFDVAAVPMLIATSLGQDPLLAPLVRSRGGLRVPGVWDPFECVVRSLVASGAGRARTRALMAQLVDRFGQEFAGGADGLTRLFPAPASLERAKLERFGVAASQAAAVRAIARAVGARALDFSAPVDDVMNALGSLAGVRESTLQQIALEGFGDPDALPFADRALRRKVAQGAAPLGSPALVARAKAWRPWRSYAVMHLWCS